MLVESVMMKPELVGRLLDEVDELIATVIASISTSRKNAPRK
ncbi:MAG: hypothetical protein WD066_15320 [Planctomycetaceae bacterium]